MPASGSQNTRGCFTKAAAGPTSDAGAQTRPAHLPLPRGVGRACRTSRTISSAVGLLLVGTEPANEPADGLTGGQPALPRGCRQFLDLPARQDERQLDYVLGVVGRPAGW